MSSVYRGEDTGELDGERSHRSIAAKTTQSRSERNLFGADGAGLDASGDDSQGEIPDYAPTAGGFVDDGFVNMQGGRVRMNCALRQAAAMGGACVLVVVALVALTSGGGGGAGAGDGSGGMVQLSTALTPSPPSLSCTLPAQPNHWNVEYFGSSQMDIPSTTRCELPNQPSVMDNGAVQLVHAFYAAVDTKNLTGISGVVAPGYTATIQGCASVGGAHVCSSSPGIGATSVDSSGARFDTGAFRAMIDNHPPRPGGTVSRELTVDQSSTTLWVVLNQYTMADGSHGTAVHTVTGSGATSKLLRSEWFGNPTAR
jgi:hypothetical protein